MKKGIALLTLLLMCINLNAQKWTKENTKAFQKSKAIAITIDYKDAKIWDLPLDKFYTYYTQSNKVTNEFIDILLEKFSKNMSYALSDKSGKNLIDVNAARFELVYHVEEITENAGYTGYFYVNDKLGNCSTTSAVRMSCNDGKWNTFDKLLLENAVKGVDKMSGKNSPFVFPFDKYER